MQKRLGMLAVAMDVSPYGYWGSALTNQFTLAWTQYTGTLQGTRTGYMVEYFPTLVFWTNQISTGTVAVVDTVLQLNTICSMQLLYYYKVYTIDKVYDIDRLIYH